MSAAIVQAVEAHGESRAVPMQDFDSKIAAAEIRLPASVVEQMDAVVAAMHELVMLPDYRAHVLSAAPELAHVPKQPDFGLFSGYDFHLTEDGPKLIEINTNAGGAFFGALIDDQRHRDGISGTHSLDYWSDLFVRQVRNEWAIADRSELRNVAIVDDNPEQQFLRLEFHLAAQELRRAGINAFVCDPRALEFRQGALYFEGHRIDLVYNRLTSFALGRAEDAPLRQALQAGSVWITPGPRAHALTACKRNLVLLRNADFLHKVGLSPASASVLQKAVPETIELTLENAASLWERRDQLYFKPISGFGSKGVYAGCKLTRKTWEEIAARGQYVAQAEVPPSRVEIAGFGSMRYDLRNYAYQGRSFMRLARLYRGQTTNFRTPGGGFAPVVVT